MQCIVVKSDEFENSSPLYIFPLNPDYVAARSLRSLRSKNTYIAIYQHDNNRVQLITVQDYMEQPVSCIPLIMFPYFPASNEVAFFQTSYRLLNQPTPIELCIGSY